jgi:UDP-2,3-diacylglucosamine hydrolase
MRPLAERAKFAAQARVESKRYTRAVSEAITDVNSAAVTDALRTHGMRTLIHGHTHRPAIHEIATSPESSRRIVLGDWYEQGSVLEGDAGSFALRTRS